jgi:TetR/AcrR family transcriptional regulator, regulator of cefoperazone and chloramphenicol sensitivity
MVDDTKLKLIAAAGAAFAERGFDAVGVREICQLAGANVAAVSYHFGDKQGLYVACLQHAQSCRVDELPPPHWPDDMPPADKLRAFIRGMLESKLASSRPRWHMEMMLREMVRPTDACQQIVEDYIRPMADTLGAILQELLPGSTWNQRSWLIGFSVVSQVLFYYVHQPVVRFLMGQEAFDSLTLDMLTDHITRFCLAAIGQGPAVTADEIPAATHGGGAT